MRDDPPKRKQTRLTHYNYAQAGCFFVTVCIHRRRDILGKIFNGKFLPSAAGKLAEASWHDLPAHHELLHLDAFVVMPNHVHGIVVLEWAPAGDAGVAPTKLRNAEDHPDRSRPGPDRDSLGAVIGSYKAAVSRRLRWRATHRSPLWQRSFFDRVIRTERELGVIREYIANNPLSWHLDELNSQRTGENSFLIG